MPVRPAPVPDLAWTPEQADDLATRVLAVWRDLLEQLPDLPVTKGSTPAEAAPAVALPVPEHPMPPAELVAHLRELAFEHTTQVGHPAFFAYVVGAGTVPGAAVELLTAGLNANLGGYRLAPGPAEIELHLTRWLAGRFGLPEGAGGMVMTGGAMANFVGLKCARDQRLGLEVREAGVREAGPVALYATEEAHVVIRRAADMLGLGAGSVRAIEMDDELRMRPAALRAAIAADRASGVTPARALRHRRDDHVRRDRPAARARRDRRRGGALAARRRGLRRRGRAVRRAAPAAGRDRARRLDRRGPAQVAVHGAVRRHRACCATSAT